MDWHIYLKTQDNSMIKRQASAICCLDSTQFRLIGTYRQTVKGWKHVLGANSKQKKIMMTIFISDPKD